jgi:hypothetical protein
MDAVKAFFAKYHAVPATDAGPDWANASDEALLGWAAGDCAAWDATADPAARRHIGARLGQLAAELRTRSIRDGRVGPMVNRRADAILAVSGRVGWGWLPAGGV